LSVRHHGFSHSSLYKVTSKQAPRNLLIQHYLGHKNIQYTVRYTELSAQRFTAFWPD